LAISSEGRRRNLFFNQFLSTWQHIGTILVAFWNKNRGKIMPVTLLIKNPREDVARRLKARAARNHRSLQGELLAIIEEAVNNDAPVSPAEVLTESGLGLKSVIISRSSL